MQHGSEGTQCLTLPVYLVEPLVELVVDSRLENPNGSSGDDWKERARLGC